MIADVFMAVLVGILVGIFTGLCPGIHVNLVCATLLALSPWLLGFTNPIVLCCFIISLAVTHSFLDTIPSIYLGAPDDATALSVLPGQKMLLQGEGYQAVKVTILGTFTGLCVALALVPLFILMATWLYPVLKPFLLWLLLGIVSFMILREEQKYWAFLLFSMSGVLGVFVFSLSGLKEPLFPLLSGLFGISGLLLSYFDNTSIPAQKIDKTIGLKIKELRKIVLGSSLAVFIIQFFPGFGPSQGAVVSNQIVRDIKHKGYLAMVGAMGTMSVVFSLVTFYALGKAKDGSIVVLSKLLEIEFGSFMLFLAIFLFAGSIAVFLTLFFAKKFSQLIVLVNYRALVISITCFVIGMVALINGPLGLLVLAASTAVGLIAPLKNIGRNHAMGCLILPVILYLFL